METIKASEDFLATIANVALSIRDVCIEFLPFVVVLVFAFGFISFLFGQDEDHKFDLKKYLFIPLFYTFLIALYPTFIDITGATTGVFVRAVDIGDDGTVFTKLGNNKEALRKFDDIYNYQIYLKNKQEAQKESNWLTSGWKYLTSSVKYGTTSALNSLSSFWDFFEVSTIKIVRTVIDYIRDVLLGFLIATGCIAILLSIMPLFQKLFTKWLKVYIAITLWAVTISVLDRIVVGLSEHGLYKVENLVKSAQKTGEYSNSVVMGGLEAINQQLENMVFGGETGYAMIDNASAWGNAFRTYNITDFPARYDAVGGSSGIDIALNVVLLICYCLVPYLTSLYAGSDGAGMFLSKVVGIASMATKNLTSKTRVAGSAAKGVGTVAKTLASK
jgi:hypothetical protein